MRTVELPACNIVATEPNAAKIKDMRTKLEDLFGKAKLLTTDRIPVDTVKAVSGFWDSLADLLGLKAEKMTLEALKVSPSAGAALVYKKLQSELVSVISPMGLLSDFKTVNTPIAFIHMILLRLFAQAADTTIEALIENEDLKIFDVIVDFVAYINSKEYTIYETSLVRNTTLLRWTQDSLPDLIEDLRLEVMSHHAISQHNTVIGKIDNVLGSLVNYAKACVLVSMNPGESFGGGQLNVHIIPSYYLAISRLKGTKFESTITLKNLYDLIDPASLSSMSAEAMVTDMSTSTELVHVSARALAKARARGTLITSLREIIHTEFGKTGSESNEVFQRLSSIAPPYRRLFILSYLFCYQVEHLDELLQASKTVINVTGLLLVSRLFLHIKKIVNAGIVLLDVHFRMIQAELSHLYTEKPATPPPAITALYKTVAPVAAGILRGLMEIPSTLEHLGSAEYGEVMEAEVHKALGRFIESAKFYGISDPFLSRLLAAGEPTTPAMLKDSSSAAAPAATIAAAGGAGSATLSESMTQPWTTDRIQEAVQRIKRLESDASKEYEKNGRSSSYEEYARAAYETCRLLSEAGIEEASNRLLTFRRRNFGVKLSYEERKEAAQKLDRINGISAGAGSALGSAVEALDLEIASEAATAATAAAPSGSSGKAATVVSAPPPPPAAPASSFNVFSIFGSVPTANPGAAPPAAPSPVVESTPAPAGGH